MIVVLEIKNECLHFLRKKDSSYPKNQKVGTVMGLLGFALKFSTNFIPSTENEMGKYSQQYFVFFQIKHKQPTEECCNRFLTNMLFSTAQQDVLVDFECAPISVFYLIDKNIGMKGCFYHLFSNIWKKVQNFGLQQRCSRVHFTHPHVLCSCLYAT